MFIYTIIKNALPLQSKETTPESVKGWIRVAHAWLNDTVSDPGEINQAFNELIKDGTIVIKGGGGPTPE